MRATGESVMLGRLPFGDDRLFRQYDSVSAFPLCAVERGVAGLQQFPWRSAVLRKFGDAYGGCDRSQGLSLMYHRQFPQSGADAFGSCLA
jgi:hypothetical protein